MMWEWCTFIFPTNISKNINLYRSWKWCVNDVEWNLVMHVTMMQQWCKNDVGMMMQQWCDVGLAFSWHNINRECRMCVNDVDWKLLHNNLCQMYIHVQQTCISPLNTLFIFLFSLSESPPAPLSPCSFLFNVM